MQDRAECTIKELQELGFEKAANTTQAAVALKRKLAIAYENFRYVRPEQIEKFQTSLAQATMRKTDRYTTVYDKLEFTPTKEYEHVPPADVLQALRKAQDFHVFDTFEIAHVTTVTERKDPDPILFGRVAGCDDYFFIAQWGDDVSISDILGEHGG